MIVSDPIDWCIDIHKSTNHMYDHYLPYYFHLRMVVQVFEDYKHLLPKNLYTMEFPVYGNSVSVEDVTHSVILGACWGHDLIEDTRVSFNDCVQRLGKDSSNIIYAVTNEKGKTREERANDKYYEGIRNTKGATFVKLCDRIANVQYGLLTKSSMTDKYRKENPNFLEKVGADLYPEMRDMLIDLLKT